jgi:cytochrome P450
MPEYARVVAEEAASLVRRLQGYGRGDYLEMQHQPVVDVYRWSRRLTTEVIARIAFSKSLGLVSGKASSEGAGGLGADKTEAMAESLQRFLGNAGRVGRYQPLAKALERLTNASPALPNLQVPVPGLEELEADTKVLDAYEKALIAERRGEEAASGEGAQDLLSKMMRTHVPAPGGRAGEQPRKLSDADVQANVREAFVAGSETTGAAIAITLHQVTAITLPLAPGCDCLAPDNAITMQQISSNPRIEWLVREELRRVLQGRRLPTYQDLDKLVYLKLCIRETLRLYPSAHVFGRKAEEETLLGGYLIPKGSSLLLSPYYLGRDQTQWGPDAHLFRPERHLPSDPLASTRSKFAWLPFGAGPRMCLGASLAMTEATIATAAMLANFKLLPASKRFSYDYLITIELEQGLPMRLQPLFDHPIQVQRGPAALVQPQPRAPSPPPATPSSTPPLD